MGNKTRPKMDRGSRAKQFMPFDALKGFREALIEKEKLYDTKKELSEEQNDEINRKLLQLSICDIAAAEYYRMGVCQKVAGTVTELNKECRILKIAETEILFDDITDLQIL